MKNIICNPDNNPDHIPTGTRFVVFRTITVFEDQYATSTQDLKPHDIFQIVKTTSTTPLYETFTIANVTTHKTYYIFTQYLQMYIDNGDIKKIANSKTSECHAKKRTNDGNKICYICGGLTTGQVWFKNKIHDVCLKCKV